MNPLELQKMDEVRRSFRRIQRWAQSYVQRNTRATGLTPAQLEALRHITYHGTLSQQELVDDLGVDKAAVTRLVAALEQAGYVYRSADPKDGRAKLIHASQLAFQVKDDVAALENDYYRWLLSGMSPEEQEQFAAQLERMMQRAKEGRRLGDGAIRRGKDGRECC